MHIEIISKNKSEDKENTHLILTDDMKNYKSTEYFYSESNKLNYGTNLIADKVGLKNNRNVNNNNLNEVLYKSYEKFTINSDYDFKGKKSSDNYEENSDDNCNLIKSDFTAKKGISWISLAFALANASIGVGMLNYPEAYHKLGGIENATLVQIAIILILFTSMSLLIYCSESCNAKDYHEVLSSIYGEKGKIICAFDIFIATFVVCVAYLVIIGDQYDRIFASLVGPDYCARWYLNRKFCIFVTSFIILPFCFLKKLNFLKHTGPLGIVAMLYIVFLTVYQHYTLEVKIPENDKSETSVTNMMAIIPVICFGYNCNEVIIPIYASLEKRSFKNFLKAAIFAWSLLFILYNIVGVYGYITFHSLVVPDIIQAFDGRDPIVLIGIIALIMKMILTYPQMSNCGKSAFVSILDHGKIETKSYENESCLERKNFIISSLWFSLSLVLAIFCSDFSFVIKFLGVLASANVFIFPSICFLSLMKKNNLKFNLFVKASLTLLCSFLILLGFIFIFLVISQVFQASPPAHSLCHL